ncbi:MAG: pyridoxamine kinase [Eubacteriales bacterium]|nr:pyridoxamine kinase [Eubacteriales bacterium]
MPLEITENHNNQKKIALINDFSGFGRCSITAQLPILSRMHVQCCPVPTAIFSNHTGYPEFFCQDYTDHLEEYLEMWEKLGLRFSGICSGFLGSVRQIRIVEEFVRKFRTGDTVVVVDPVMGDYGKLYAAYPPEMCGELKRLVALADIVTPNLTEACLLTDTPYKEKWTSAELETLIRKVAALGVKRVVITGIPAGSMLCNLCYDCTSGTEVLRRNRTHKIGVSRAGTGDIFTAVIAADAVNGVPFEVSVLKASGFIRKCIMKAIEMDLPTEDGVPFEELMEQLRWK